jgi:hypothetical protein
MTASGDMLAIGALLISVVSVSLAAAALGWTIYRDVFSKPRAKVNAVLCIVTGEQKPRHFINVTITNFGPGPLRLDALHIRYRDGLWFASPWDRHAIVLDDTRAAHLSATLPTKLDVGERASLLYTWDEKCFAELALTGVGVVDSFGRNHWAPGGQVRALHKSFRAHFPDAKPIFADGPDEGAPPKT